MKIYFHLNIEGFSNSYIVANPVSREAIIIDPGKITDEMIEHIERDQYQLVAVLVTHNHSSHTRGLKTLRKIYNPRIYAADYEVAESDTIVLKGDGVLRIAGLTVSYMSVPGHSSDSMVFKIGRVMFTGDTLGAGTISPTNSSYAKKTLMSNIQTKILSQQDDMVIMPGHGPPSTTSAEKKFNLELGCPILHNLPSMKPYTY